MSWEIMHGGLGPGVAAGLSAVSFLCSLITAAFGIGGGAVMLGVMAVFLPAPAIIPLHGLVQLGSNVGRTALFIKYIHTATVVPFLIGSCVGVAIGGTFVVQLNPGMIRVGVGLFILWTILFKPPASMRSSAAVTGLFSSFLTMFFGGTGPFVAAYVKTLDLDRLGYSATHALLMTAQHLFKTIAFALLGFAFAHWLGLVALLIGSGFLGTVAGRHILLRIDERKFRVALNAVLFLLALQLIIWGGTRLFQDYAPG
ncbi:sulfite exporter TauE/SafE family protein [Roseobacter ponti]|uniref:Probable membrane transporter protein n=1 Tax=Roseobacter ponti TaxID=1891787 RepID=A0A858ST99_9RHOB|nr:sulfite exporter TauE/SafE family protein [Roseobacter ponti]QJF51168.1 sulfite exporter TauE/SafE family protein [Roseobacter ponti]